LGGPAWLLATDYLAQMPRELHVLGRCGWVDGWLRVVIPGQVECCLLADFDSIWLAEGDPLLPVEPVQFQRQVSERNGHTVRPVEDKRSANADVEYHS